MLLIAIVDDDPKDASQLKDCVEAYCRKNSLAALVHTYRDGLDFIRGAETHDIIFLDIQMGKLDGLETARLMRKINQESILIFVTNMAQFAIKGYEVDALDFIIKPASLASIVYVMDKAMKRLDGTLFSSIEWAAPGFINLRLGHQWYESVLKAAGNDKKVHLMPAYGHDLASAFNQFYAGESILNAKESRNAKLTLVECAKTVLADVLDCLGMGAPEEM